MRALNSEPTDQLDIDGDVTVLLIVSNGSGIDVDFEDQTVWMPKPFGPCDDEWPGNEYHSIGGVNFRGTLGSVIPPVRCDGLEEMGSFYSLVATTMTIFTTAAMFF